jgi:serine/threonine protein phosphatase 1
VQKETHFLEITNSKKIWAIGSIHSRLQSFISIKKHLLKNFQKDDYLVFLGNVIGLGEESKQTLSSVIDLRNALMAKFLLKPNKIIFLRGAQEEMFLKLLQLQTAPNPQDIIMWMLDHGIDATIKSYGLSTDEIVNISSQGAIAISKWTKKLSCMLSEEPGHQQYFIHLKHAAFSESKKILFLNRGVDVSRPLSAQNDCFWWGYQNFSDLKEPYNTFTRIVRGYESSKSNLLEHSKSKIVCSLFRQPLNSKKIIAGIFTDSGEILDLFESS